MLRSLVTERCNKYEIIVDLRRNKFIFVKVFDLTFTKLLYSYAIKEIIKVVFSIDYVT